MKLGELAAALQIELRGDSGIEIVTPAPIEAAGPGTVSFIAAPRYLAILKRVSPACVITTAELAENLPCAALISKQPALDFARALGIFHPSYRPKEEIDPTARIDPGARIGQRASIGAFSVIGADVTIGQRAVIHPHVTIYPGVTIGDDLVAHSYVSIREKVVIGDRVILHNGVVIGSDGFGFAEIDKSLIKIPQIGNVVVESDVEIGANSTVDRATVGSTLIRRGVKLDNLVHIGHNCEVGAYSRLAALAGIAGSTKIGEWCEFGGQTGVADHARIGNRVRVAAQSGIPNDVADNLTIAGTPAVDIRTWRRQVAALVRLPELLRRMRAVEKRAGIAKAL